MARDAVRLVPVHLPMVLGAGVVGEAARRGLRNAPRGWLQREEAGIGAGSRYKLLIVGAVLKNAHTHT